MFRRELARGTASGKMGFLTPELASAVPLQATMQVNQEVHTAHNEKQKCRPYKQYIYSYNLNQTRQILFAIDVIATMLNCVPPCYACMFSGDLHFMGSPDHESFATLKLYTQKLCL